MHAAGFTGNYCQISFFVAMKLRIILNNYPTTLTGRSGVIAKNYGLRYNPSGLLKSI